MAQGRRSNDPKTYILNFFYDDDDGSALTARINDHRFHIIVDPAKLRKSGGVANDVLQEYKRKLEALRLASSEEASQTGPDVEANANPAPEAGVRCVCGATEDGDLMMTACDKCGVWQHNACMDLTEDEEKVAKAAYFCEHCDPNRHNKLLSAIERGQRPWKARKEQAERKADTADARSSEHFHGSPDSGVELDADAQDEPPKADARLVNSADSGLGMEQDHAEIELDLQNWIMSCFGNEVEHVAPPQEQQKSSTLFDWYNAPVHFYEVEVQDGALAPVPLEENKQLQRRMDELVPYLDIPKYIANYGILMADPTSVNVLESSDSIEPVHPLHVIFRNEEYFFKPVDPTQPGPTKREINLLHRIQKFGLHDQIKAPRLHGLVSSSPGDKTSIVGMLLTNVQNATPLTTLMDSDISEVKRHKWAKESERIVKVLHDHDIVWGDAKGDNFVVDKDDELWIIDFGGSYTEGWVDPELKETIEGDDSGLEKIVSALHDPDGNTFDPSEDIAPLRGSSRSMGQKRKASSKQSESDATGQASDESPKKVRL